MVFRKFFGLPTTVQHVTLFSVWNEKKNQHAFFAKAAYFTKLPGAFSPVFYTYGFFAKLSGEKISLWNFFRKNKYFRENMPKSHVIKNIFTKVAPYSQAVTFCNKGRKLNICSFSRTLSPRYERKWSKITFAKFFAKMRKRKFPF